MGPCSAALSASVILFHEILSRRKLEGAIRRSAHSGDKSMESRLGNESRDFALFVILNRFRLAAPAHANFEINSSEATIPCQFGAVKGFIRAVLLDAESS
jgi:hypothetical protein